MIVRDKVTNRIIGLSPSDILASGKCAHCKDIIWSESEKHRVMCFCGRIQVHGSAVLTEDEFKQDHLTPLPSEIRNALAENYSIIN